MTTHTSHSNSSKLSSSNSKTSNLSSANMSNTLEVLQVDEFARERFVLRGYRPKLGFNDCFRSWFGWHNESVNIWTHLLACIFYLFRLYSHMCDDFWTELPLLIQITGFIVCYAISTLFHTFSCHSSHVRLRFLYLDHLSISLGTYTTYLALIVSLFKCQPALMMLHLVLELLAFACLVRSFDETPYRRCGNHFCRKNLKYLIIMGLYSWIPVLHWIHHYGHNQPLVQEKFWSLVYIFQFGALGVAVLVARLPERALHNGLTDYVGSSHQLWHLVTMVGMGLWYFENLGENSSPKCFSLEQIKSDEFADDHVILGLGWNEWIALVPSVILDLLAIEGVSRDAL